MPRHHFGEFLGGAARVEGRYRVSAARNLDARFERQPEHLRGAGGNFLDLAYDMRRQAFGMRLGDLEQHPGNIDRRHQVRSVFLHDGERFDIGIGAMLDRIDA
jgi:hypothetical protein